jgi:hypothetical protein
MAEPKCYNCGQVDIADLSGTGQLQQMNKMIADHYTVIIVSIIIIIVMCFVIYYFAKELVNVFKKYKKAYFENTTIYNNTDDEIYDDEQVISNTARFYDANKHEFVKEIERAYSDYNKTKTSSIRREYSKPNDDVIDHGILYTTNDSYDYGTNNKLISFSKASE